MEKRAIPLTLAKVAAELDEIVTRARRLTIDRRDPHRFHEEKDAICRSLRQLAEEARCSDARRRSVRP